MRIKRAYKNLLSGFLLAVLITSIVIPTFYSFNRDYYNLFDNIPDNINPKNPIEPEIPEPFIWDPDYPSSSASCLFNILNNFETSFGLYSPETLEYTANIPLISIPQDDNILYTEVEDYWRVDTLLDRESIEFFKQYGFVLVDEGSQDMYSYYDPARKGMGANYITTDLCLHTFHTLYDMYLRIIEGEHLYGDFQDLINALRDNQLALNASISDNKVRTALYNNIAYLSVILKLLNSSTVIPSVVQQLVEEELNNIDNQVVTYSAIFGYLEDFTQYIVRGHYTRNEILSNYFQAFMYASRMGFLIQNPSLNHQKAIEQTRMALLLLSSFNQTVASTTIWEIWESINKPISFFVGISDDLTAYDYYEVWCNHGKPTGDSLAEDTIIEDIIDELKTYPSPKIVSMVMEDFEDPENYTRGFRLFGQSFTPDSYIFQEIIDPNVESRLIPSALDIFSVFGSPRAEFYSQSQNDIYPDYNGQIINLRNEFITYDESDWSQNLYWLWLYSLFPLLKPVDEGYPRYMMNDTWTDKSLMTSLGSWTELKHDSILYNKMAMSFLSAGFGLGFVEPYPEVYSRLCSLLNLMIIGLDNLNLLNDDFRNRLNDTRRIFDRFKNISIKELENIELTSSDSTFLHDVGKVLEELQEFPEAEYQQWLGVVDKRMALVADVFTEINSGQVIEVGTGDPFAIYVIVQDNEGNLRVVKGATYAYFEFLYPMAQRLTDEEWQDMVDSNPPDMPEWITNSLPIGERDLYLSFNQEFRVSVIQCYKGKAENIWLNYN